MQLRRCMLKCLREVLMVEFQLLCHAYTEPAIKGKKKYEVRTKKVKLKPFRIHKPLRFTLEPELSLTFFRVSGLANNCNLRWNSR